MLIGILSDTHGHLPRTLAAVERLASLEVELVIHCGDIGSPAVVDLFSAWPTHFVFGNVDDPKTLRVAISEAGQSCHERFGKLELQEKAIAFLHGDDKRLLRGTINSGRWDLVCFGHTHIAEVVHQGHTLALNPGALYRTSQPSLAVVQLPSLKVNTVTVA